MIAPGVVGTGGRETSVRAAELAQPSGSRVSADSSNTVFSIVFFLVAPVVGHQPGEEDEQVAEQDQQVIHSGATRRHPWT